MDKIAYLVLAHNDPSHLKRMINALDYRADFYIHLDLKVTIDDFKSVIGEKSNIFWIDERVKVNWGGFNMVKATISLLKTCLSTGILYKRIILLSGSDYPIKSNKQIHSFFLDNQNVEFIRAFNITESKSKHYVDQISSYFFMDVSFTKSKLLNHILRKTFNLSAFLFKKNPFVITAKEEIPVYFGSQWWAITYDCANDILNFIDDNPSIYKYFKHSFAPDEKFFHTIIFNTPHKSKTTNKGSEPFIQGTSNWANLHIIHPSLSKWYDEDDVAEVLESEKLFIRKVNSEHSSKLLDIIDLQKDMLN
ncbi:hypothetical protein AZK53_05345 [Priestia megaterium]|uniref:beta-1,6-N-acetylglucosaminyltransferase n=1 Tax=Priestia megaterium TaxID=1404 RepID=UPI0007CDB30E|nr:beta-1,6-N-acetylglucosaminyltransferase [Priestia megaterium]ANF45122.1 hypothetical protein AZK53_05345 [Priestia megaterium]